METSLPCWECRYFKRWASSVPVHTETPSIQYIWKSCSCRFQGLVRSPKCWPILMAVSFQILQWLLQGNMGCQVWSHNKMQAHSNMLNIDPDRTGSGRRKAASTSKAAQDLVSSAPHGRVAETLQQFGAPSPMLPFLSGAMMWFQKGNIVHSGLLFTSSNCGADDRIWLWCIQMHGQGKLFFVWSQQKKS